MEKEFARYYAIGGEQGLECFEGQFRQQVFPWHFHDTYTVVMVDTGSVVYAFNEQRVVVKAGEVLVINPYEPHCNYAADSRGWTYRVFFLPIAFLNAATAGPLVCFAKKPVHQVILYQQLAELNGQLKKSMRQSNYDACVQQVAALLKQHCAYKKASLHFNQRLLPAILHIQNNLHRKITIRELAKACFLSASHFQRLFKSSYGLTVHAFIHMKRMEAGRKLLRQKEQIASAALETGFFDQSHFHHSFKKMYGLTPKQFASV